MVRDSAFSVGKIVGTVLKGLNVHQIPLEFLVARHVKKLKVSYL